MNEGSGTQEGMGGLEEQLRERTALLTHAQQIAGVGSWVWYPHDNRNEWSPYARRIFGFSDDAAESGDPNLFFNAIHPDDRDEIVRHAWESFATGSRSSAEYRVVHPDGSTRWVRAQAEVECAADGDPLRVVGVVMDVTDRRRTELDLREKARFLERAHEVARLGSFSVDIARRQVHIARETARLLGIGSEPVERGIAEFRSQFVVDEPEQWAAQMEIAYRGGGPFSFEHRLRSTSGETIWARLHGSVELDEFGLPVRAVAIIQDVTEQRLLEEQFRQVQKLEAVGQLASGVAHDFNNLLLVIGGNAQLALATDDGAARTELTEILRAAGRAGELVRQLLAFSRADVCEPGALDLNCVVESVRRMLDRLLVENIEIRTELTDDDATVFADGGQLEQVLLNLAVNARDAMPDGGRLSIVTDADAESVTVRVSDTGVGMDEHTRERVFDPFFTTKPKGEGTGLGLSTVYGIVTKAGGRITVASAPGLGTTFTITLPHVAAEEEREIAPAPAAVDDGNGQRILLVEDDAMVRNVAAGMLGRAGYEIATAENGEDALRLFDEGNEYDLIVSDLIMPRMTGLQLTAALRARGHELPTVYTSGYAEAELAPDNELGESRFVAKPFSGEEVTAAVRDLLQRAA